MTDYLNTFTLAGTLAADPEVQAFESGAVVARLLLTVKMDEPRRRVDVIPVVVWDPEDTILDFQRGDDLLVYGSIQRRFWEAPDGRRSRVEVVASAVLAQEEIREEVG